MCGTQLQLGTDPANGLGWLAQNCLLDDTQPYVRTIAYAMRGSWRSGSWQGTRTS